MCDADLCLCGVQHAACDGGEAGGGQPASRSTGRAAGGEGKGDGGCQPAAHHPAERRADAETESER